MLGFVCPVEFNSRKLGPLPICGDGVMFPKGLLWMAEMEFTNVFNTEVIGNEDKNNWASSVVPENGSCGRFIVTGFVEAFADNNIHHFSSLFQARASSGFFEIDPYISGVSSEVVFVNELLGDVQDIDANILRMLHERF